MEKTKSFKNAYFQAEVIQLGLQECIKDPNAKSSYRLRREVETWEFDSENEFFADYRRPHLSSNIRKSIENISIGIDYIKNSDTTIRIQASTRSQIEGMFEVFERHYSSSIQESDEEPKGPIIFIGHGKSSLWRELKDHLSDKHGFKIEAYETGARAGHTIRDILDEMASKSTFAILVMTGEDENKDGKFQARPNVIHEIGLFQGRLGFNKAIVLLESGTEEFSNLSGIQQLRFSKDNIKETFGDVLATLKREFETKKSK